MPEQVYREFNPPCTGSVSRETLKGVTAHDVLSVVDRRTVDDSTKTQEERDAAATRIERRRVAEGHRPNSQGTETHEDLVRVVLMRRAVLLGETAVPQNVVAPTGTDTQPDVAHRMLSSVCRVVGVKL